METLYFKFRCKKCDFASENVNDIREHSEKCIDKPVIKSLPFECFVCEDTFESQALLTNHNLTVHDLDEDAMEEETEGNELIKAKTEPIEMKHKPIEVKNEPIKVKIEPFEDKNETAS